MWFHHGASLKGRERHRVSQQAVSQKYPMPLCRAHAWNAIQLRHQSQSRSSLAAFCSVCTTTRATTDAHQIHSFVTIQVLKDEREKKRVKILKFHRRRKNVEERTTLRYGTV